MKVSIKGVVAGGMVDVLSSTILGSICLIFYVVIKSVTGHFLGQPTHATPSVIHDLVLRLFMLILGMACSCLGGYVAARIAKHDELLNGGVSSFLCFLLGTILMLNTKSSSPQLQIVLLFSAPLMGILGGATARRLAQARTRGV